MELTQRQRELADAALALLAREGTTGVTFRSVATESGWSLGAVQKAFATKDELLAAMFQRLRDSASAVPEGEPGRPTLGEWLMELFMRLMPFEQEIRDLSIQGAAFCDRAAFDEAIADAVKTSDDEIRSRLALLVRRSQAEGEVAPGVEPEAVAWGFWAFSQGAATQLLYDRRPVDEVRKLAQLVISALLAGTTPGSRT